MEEHLVGEVSKGCCGGGDDGHSGQARVRVHEGVHGGWGGVEVVGQHVVRGLQGCQQT